MKTLLLNINRQRQIFYSFHTKVTHTKPYYTMKRAASSDASEAKGSKKSKQSSLLDAFGGGSTSSKKQKIESTWKNYGDAVKGLKPLSYMTCKDLKGSNKIAGFDMDGCLIVPKSNAKFPKNADDWKFMLSQVQPKLKALHGDGYKVVIFTNQAGIEKNKAKESDIQGKITKIMNELGFPVQAFISTGENVYRKPYTGSWDFMASNCNEGKTIDKENSFFVGDAAGRPKDWQKGKKKDHSCSDRKFAANVGVRFYTPEEYFLGMKAFSRFDWGSINPKTLLSSAQNLDVKQFEDITSKETELVILVGFPASGKSTFAKRYLESKGYVVVNRDTLKTQEKCEKTVHEALKAKKSVAVDNTNPSKEARQAYVKIAKTYNTPVRCFQFDVTIEAAKHMNFYRQLITNGKHRRVPDVGYNVFKSRYVAPDKSEGFKDIIKIPFIPTFDRDEEKEKFLHWT